MPPRAVSPGDSPRPIPWRPPLTADCPPSPDPTLPRAPIPVRSSLSVPIATSTVASLGDISNESPRGHYQRVTTWRDSAMEGFRDILPPEITLERGVA